MKHFLKFFALFLILTQSLIADLVLYSSNRCPYCKDVQKWLDDNHKSVNTIIVDDNKQARDELKRIGGKTQVPCLIIDGYPLYGSKDIIRWMQTHPERLQDVPLKNTNRH
jgi:glutaredoxin